MNSCTVTANAGELKYEDLGYALHILHKFIFKINRTVTPITKQSEHGL